MNTKGMTPEYLVALIVIGVFLVSALYIWGDDIKPILMGTSQTGTCNLEFLLSHVADTGAIQGCKKNNVLVTEQMLAEKAGSAAREYTEAKRQGLLVQTDAIDLEASLDPSQKGAKEAWALNRILADEMTDCYDKTLGGRFLEKDVAGVLSSNIVCVICSRIVLTEEAKRVFTGTNYEIGGHIQTAFNPWMERIPARQTYSQKLAGAVSIPESLLDDQEKKTNALYDALTNYNPSFTRPMAVMLVNIPYQSVFGSGKDMRWIQVYPYEDVTNNEVIALIERSTPTIPFAPGSYILAALTKRKAKCEVIIE